MVHLIGGNAIPGHERARKPLGDGEPHCKRRHHGNREQTHVRESGQLAQCLQKPPWSVRLFEIANDEPIHMIAARA